MEDSVIIEMSDVPEYLHDSEFYRSLEDDAQFSVPKRCFKQDISVETLQDVKSLLDTLRFWGVKLSVIPESLIAYYMSKTKHIHDLTVEYRKELPFLKLLEEISNAPCNLRMETAASAGLIEVMTYLLSPHQGRRGEVCSAAAQNGHLNCLQFAREQGYGWDDNVTLEAAKNGHYECLKYAFQQKCPADLKKCMNAAVRAREKNYPTLLLLRELGCQWPSDPSYYLRDLNFAEFAISHGYVLPKYALREEACYHGLKEMQFVHQHGGEWDAWIPSILAKAGKLDCLRYALEWGCPADGTISRIAASTGSLECLRLVREFQLEWNAGTAAAAASAGHLDCLQYAHEQGCRWNEETCTVAAQHGHIECLKYALQQGCPRHELICTIAARKGRVACLKYAHEQGCPWNEETCTAAAQHGHIECLKHAHEQGCPWNEETCTAAAQHGHIECLKYAHEQGCPWDVSTYTAARAHRTCKLYVRLQGCPRPAAVDAPVRKRSIWYFPKPSGQAGSL